MNPPAGVPATWATVADTAGVTVEELHWHDAGDVCHLMGRVTDRLTGESLTLGMLQWVAATRAWAASQVPPAHVEYWPADQ